MKYLNQILMLLCIAIVGAARQVFGPAGMRESAFNAAPPKVHETGAVGRVAEAAFTLRHLLATKGTAAGSMIICTATTEPIGPCIDEPAIAERGTVHALGAVQGTITLIGSKAIAEDTRVYTTAGGKITDTAVNDSWLVGKTHAACTGDGQPAEVIPCFPVQQTV